MIYSRHEFIDAIYKGVYTAKTIPQTDPLLVPEHDGNLSQWFICIKPLWPNYSHEYNKDYKGSVRCYSRSENAEWWGFTNKDDIVQWVLRWT
jgi:hypothetical protein